MSASKTKIKLPKRFRKAQAAQAEKATVLGKVGKEKVEGLKKDILKGLSKNWPEVLEVILERYVNVDNDASGPVVLEIEPWCANDGPKKERNMHRRFLGRVNNVSRYGKVVYPPYKRLPTHAKILLDGGIPFDRLKMLKVVGRNAQGQRVTRFFIPSTKKNPTGESQ